MKDVIKNLEKQKKDEELRVRRAWDYLHDLVNLAEEENTSYHLADLIDMRENELKIEIFRQQQIKMEFIKDASEKDALALTECLDLIHMSSQRQLNGLIELRAKIADEISLSIALMNKLYALANPKELDARLKKVTELSAAIEKISAALSDERIYNMLMSLSK